MKSVLVSANMHAVIAHRSITMVIAFFTNRMIVFFAPQNYTKKTEYANLCRIFCILSVILSYSGYFMQLNAQPPEGMRKDIPHRLGEVVVAVVLPFVYTAPHQPFAGVMEGL